MKSAILALAAIVLPVSATAFQTAAQSYSGPGGAIVIDTGHLLKADGTAELVTGPVAVGTVFLRQKLVYAHTGVLTAPLSLSGKPGKVELPAGTPVFGYEHGWSYRGASIWCTLPGKSPIVCLITDATRTVWTEGQDPTFRNMVFLHPDDDTAPTPSVQDKPLDADTPMSVEYSIGDASKLPPHLTPEMRKGPMGQPSAMVIDFSFTRGAEVKYKGDYRYPVLRDIIVKVSGAPDVRLHPVAGAKPFEVSVDGQ